MRARSWALLVCLGLAAVAVAVAPTPAQAQDKGNGAPDYEAARQAYMTAEKAFVKGEYGIAAREYGNAYAITKDPVLFFKIGLAHEKNGNCEAAVVYYRRYLKEGNPDAENKRLTEQSVARCAGDSGGGTGTGDTGGGTGTGDTGGGTGTGDTGGGTGTGDTGGGTGDTGGGAGTGGGANLGGGGGGPPPPPIDNPVGPTWKKTAAWVSVGATVAFLTTGAVLGLSASSRQEDIENLIDFRGTGGEPATFEGSVKEKYEDLVDEGKQLDMLSKVAFGLAGASCAAAVVFFVLEGSSGGSSSATASTGLTPMVGTHEVGVRMGWSF